MADSIGAVSIEEPDVEGKMKKGEGEGEGEGEGA